MKLFISLIILIVFLTSCISPNISDVEKNLDLNKLDTVYLIKYLENQSLNEKNLQTNPSGDNLKNKYNIINLIDTTKLIDSSFAIMGYNVPSYFKVNQKATIKLRISKENTIESVVIGNRNIPLVGLSSSDNIILETIKVSDQMSAKLYTDKEYFVVELVNSGSTQNIEEWGYTEWVWRVTPLKSGSSYIKMIITISGKDIVVYEKEIPVESNWSWSLSNWLIKWWQALTATIITPILIPFFIWLWKRKKRKSKE